jgi:hypothetical protein
LLFEGLQLNLVQIDVILAYELSDQITLGDLLVLIATQVTPECLHWLGHEVHQRQGIVWNAVIDEL